MQRILISELVHDTESGTDLLVRRLDRAFEPSRVAAERQKSEAADADGIAVSGLDARLRALLGGPELGHVSALLEAEGALLVAYLPAGSREETLLARLPRSDEGEWGRSGGEFDWSGRIRSRVFASYVGEAWVLAELAFEWRPFGS